MTFDVITVGSIPSTNTALKEWARGEGILSARGPLKPCTVLRAVTQTGGRGRRGRSFFSPPGGLYMSVYLPEEAVSFPRELTARLCAAVCAALEKVSGKSLLIKWVNDLYADGKKICGILCEGIPGGYVCGIGVNLAAPAGGFPPEAGPAGALAVPDAGPETVLRTVLDLIPDALKESYHDTALGMYREKNMLLNENVLWVCGERRVPLRVTGIGNDFSLTGVDENMVSLSVSAGETVLRKGVCP